MLWVQRSQMSCGTLVWISSVMCLGLFWVVTETQQREIPCISPIYNQYYCFISVVTQSCFGVFNLLPANCPVVAVNKYN